MENTLKHADKHTKHAHKRTKQGIAKWAKCVIIQERVRDVHTCPWWTCMGADGCGGIQLWVGAREGGKTSHARSLFVVVGACPSPRENKKR